jgi:hypothetical protein
MLLEVPPPLFRTLSPAMRPLWLTGNCLFRTILSIDREFQDLVGRSLSSTFVGNLPGAAVEGCLFLRVYYYM